ncbi:ankyrin repeat domain-containing protein [Acrocarpospora macrocephala]|uniref:ankyrin repeat domain-containing protein n=1 Tax=Acrocarpospora macrocephala TaxID=150177 RepID=UPI001478B28B|nr:ankyrin repeat domain-containing protein [Acrocarpospora macrocephala]
MTGSELMAAVAEDDLERARELLRPGMDLNPARGTTPLYEAAVHGNGEMIRLLLEYGADPDLPSHGEDEGLPLCAAACWDHDEAVRALLDGGANPDTAEDGGWTALLWAASLGHLATADVLLDGGATPDAGCPHTPLTAAARFGAYGIVWSLLEHGADPAKPDESGARALEIALELSEADIEALLTSQIDTGSTSSETRNESSKIGVSEGAPAERVQREGAQGERVQRGRIHGERVQGKGDQGEHIHGERARGESDSRGVILVVSRSHAADGTELVEVEANGTRLAMQRGHAAVATILEDALGIRTPVAELVARALPYRDRDADGETWWAAVHSVQNRHDDETFRAAVELCASSDPMTRDFGVNVLSQFGFTADSRPYLERTLPTLQRLAEREQDPRVVESVLSALGQQGDPRALPEVLAIIGRPGREQSVRDPIALSAVLPPGHAEGLATLIVLSQHPSPEIRDYATNGLAALNSDDFDDSQILEALSARLTDPDLSTTAEAAAALAARHDRRAIDAIHRILCETDPDDPDDDYIRDLALEAAAHLNLDLSDLTH